MAPSSMSTSPSRDERALLTEPGTEIDEDDGEESVTVVQLRPPEHDRSFAKPRSCTSPSEIVVTVLVCIAFMLVGPLLIMSNKYLLTNAGFRFPILLTALHQASSAICSALLVKQPCAVMPLEHEVSWSDWWRRIFLVGMLTTAALCTGNAAYLYLTVSFIEILKGFTPVVTIMVQVLFGEPPPSCKIAAVVLMISLGTAISSFGELNLDVTGLLFMLASVYCEATRLMLTQRLLTHMRLHVLEGLYHISPASAVGAVAVAAVIEMPRFPRHRFLASLPHTWHLFAVNALLGFLVNVVSFLVIKRTSVVMLKLLAISRNCLVVFAGVVLFSESVSPLQFCGYSISIVFFVIYNVLLLRQPKA